MIKESSLSRKPFLFVAQFLESVQESSRRQRNFPITRGHDDGGPGDSQSIPALPGANLLRYNVDALVWIPALSLYPDVFEPEIDGLLVLRLEAEGGDLGFKLIESKEVLFGKARFAF